MNVIYDLYIYLYIIYKCILVGVDGWRPVAQRYGQIKGSPGINRSRLAVIDVLAGPFINFHQFAAAVVGVAVAVVE